MNSYKKVILTGATGLIGKEAIQYLKEENFEILPLSSKICNLFHKDEIDKVFSEFKPQYLLNFAWCATGDYLTSDLNYKFVDGGMNMLKSFKKYGGMRAVFAGTCFEYKFKNEPLKENDELNPTTTYAKCKVELSQKATAFCKENDIDFAWGRIFYVYGKNENEKRLTPYIINNLKNNIPVEIKCGQLIKDYMYTKDIARAFVKVLTSNYEGTINICSGNGISLEDYGKAIAKKLNKTHLLTIKHEQTSQPERIVGDNTKLATLGFLPKYQLKEALSEII